MGRRAQIDLNKLVKLLDKGLTIGELAQYFGVSKEAVSQQLERLGLDTRAIVEYKVWTRFLPHIIAHKQKLLLAALTPEKIEKMRGKDLILGFAILEDKRRQIEGLGQQSVVNLIQIVQKVEEKITKKPEEYVDGAAEVLDNA